MTKYLREVVNSRRGGAFLLVIFFLLTAFQLRAQNVAPSMSDGGGYHFAKDGIYIDMSVGELAVSTLTISSQVITQGFLQPISIEQPCAVPELTYYPNPVVDQITIAALDCDVHVSYVEAYDLYGKLVLLTESEENTVDLTPIGIGVYFLRAYADSGQLIGTVKIIKTTV
jgi:hypothetical protein